MLHAAIRLNPGQGAALTGYDASKAVTMRGVQKIIGIPGGIAVIANNTWRAIRAAEAITCDWAAAPYPAAMAEHWQALADSFTSDAQDSQFRDEGDVEAALARGTDIEVEYRAPYLAHAPLEPLNATVRYTPERIDIWTGTQVPRFVETNVARITGLDRDSIHVHAAMIGGSFGHRLEDEVVRHATHIAMAMPGRPIKLTYSREEDMAHDFPRLIAMESHPARVENGAVRASDPDIASRSLLLL